jgi:hypothetical protein
MDPADKEEQKRKLEEMIKRKHEVEQKKKQIVEPSNKEVFRYEELIRDKGRKKTTKDRVFNNAFCVEIKEEQERVLNIIKDPPSKPEPTWYDQVLEKERKLKREETRLAQDRLKMIDKRTRYAEIIREVLSPSTRARNTEAIPLIRSSSKKESRDDRTSVKSPEISQKSDQFFVRKLQPRSLSKKELNGRSPASRQTIPAVKSDI